MTLWTDPPVGQWFVSPDGVRWWFDSGDIALDFAIPARWATAARVGDWNAPPDLDSG